jgi:peptide N-acetyl-beta-D-glucosaminyl asparaginase amidase A
MIRFSLPAVSRFLIASGAIAILTICSVAQTRTAPSVPQTGSANTVTADPPLPRPNTQPCTVQLFSNVTFADFSPKSFQYAPPTDCPGPWAKVIFQADYNVTAGRQFDRTANVWIGGTNVYFGTTAEPSRTVARSWHIESDLTDYSALFTVPQPGEADLGNIVNSTFNGVLFGSASLQFYPLAQHQQAPRTADIVLPMSAGTNGGSVLLFSPSEKNMRTFALPTNIERAYLDIIAQSQIGDEFWYTCVPNDVTAELESCGSTAFREVEVAIDGQPAGVAPVYPWIYTGGIDPFLWRPIPGIETLNFSPYRVDLTPFAGPLSDGKLHQVAFSVFNNGNYFATAGALLLYLDPASTQVTGEVTQNTIGTVTPSVDENLSKAADGTVTGTVSVTSSRKFGLAGFVKTAHGKIQTEINQSIDFSSVQTFQVNATTPTGTPDVQDINQKTTISSLTSRRGEGPEENIFLHAEYPLVLNFSFTANADGSFTQATTIDEQLTRGELHSIGNHPVSFTFLQRSNTPSDTLLFNSSFGVTGNQNQHSTEKYFYTDSTGACFSRTISAATGLLTSVSDGEGCKH